MIMNINASRWAATTPPFEMGQQRTETMLAMQKELLGAYEEARRAWLARVQSEVELWTGLAQKLTATRSVPEAVAAYQGCVAQRMKMAAEDAQRIAEECQKGMTKVSGALSNGLADRNYGQLTRDVAKPWLHSWS
jgi:hypothetical protein